MVLVSRRAWSTVLLLGACLAGARADGPLSLDVVRLGGREYVAVRDIARYYGLGRDLAATVDQARYEAGGSQLRLQAPRSEIQLNGVDVWLTAPVMAAGNRLWVARLDLLKTLDPVLRFRQFRGAKHVQRIVLDPGHGGADRGTRGRSGRSEKTLTIDLARRVEKRLAAAGLRVYLTRRSDATLELADRTRFADARQADLFVSLHFNSAFGDADGIEIYCLPPAGATSTASGRRRGSNQAWLAANRFDNENIWLAHCVQGALLRATRATDRGVRRARFQVLRDAPCPAVLVEAGFLSNRAEEGQIATESYRDQLAAAIADGILKYQQSRE